MTTPFEKYLSVAAPIKGIREFSSMVSSKITQLRSERTKKIYNYVHTEIVGLVDKMDFPHFESVIKSLSRLYRSKIDIDEGLLEMRKYIDEILTNKPAEQSDDDDDDVDGSEYEIEDETYSPSKPTRLDTEPEHSPLSEDPKTPTHKLTAAKKAAKAKGSPQKSKRSASLGRKTANHVVDKAAMVKMLQDAINSEKK